MAPPILLATWATTLFGLLLFLIALFLILLILIQRGRGGGLTGAFGGMGGQSAFGSKAGDTFTRITIVVASIWMVLCVLGVMFLGNESDPLANGRGTSAETEESREAATSDDPAAATDNKSSDAAPSASPESELELAPPAADDE